MGRRACSYSAAAAHRVLGVRLAALDAEELVARVTLTSQRLLDAAQVLVQAAAQVGQARVVARSKEWRRIKGGGCPEGWSAIVALAAVPLWHGADCARCRRAGPRFRAQCASMSSLHPSPRLALRCGSRPRVVAGALPAAAQADARIR
jgi:hypothetical protein